MLNNYRIFFQKRSTLLKLSISPSLSQPTKILFVLSISSKKHVQVIIEILLDTSYLALAHDPGVIVLFSALKLFNESMTCNLAQSIQNNIILYQ